MQTFLPYAPIVNVIAVLVIFVACIVRPTRSLGGAVLRGVLTLATLLLFARWSSPTYYAYASVLLVLGLALLPARVRIEASDARA